MSYKKSTIGEECKVGDGAHASIQRQSTGKLYLSAKNFTKNGLTLEDVSFISYKDFNKYFNSNSKALTKPRCNDLILGIIGSGLGVPYLINPKVEEFGISSSVAIIRPNNENLYPAYLYFWMIGPYFQRHLKNIQSGSAQGFLSLEMIRSLPLLLPNLPTQHKIASILSAYDELIDNNKQRIRLLEEMAGEIYKEWFVRFRFPGYETTKFFDEDGKEISCETVGAMPEGWTQTRLETICDFQMGQSPLSEFYNEDGQGLPFHQGVTNFNSRFPNHVTYCTDLKRIADKGDILLSVRAPVGRINIATTKLVIGRGLSSVKHKKALPNYCYYLLKEIFKKEDSFGNGAVFNAVTKNDLLRIKLNEPSFEVCKKFQDLIQPIDDEIKVLTDKNQLLQQTRDLLLPRLISGKLSVEHLVEEQEAGLSIAAEPEVNYQAIK